MAETATTANAWDTSRIKLAIHVTQVLLRNPAILARLALSVNQVSAGQLVIGLGMRLITDPAYRCPAPARRPRRFDKRRHADAASRSARLRSSRSRLLARRAERTEDLTPREESRKHDCMNAA